MAGSPLVVKRDGTREPFDSQKLSRGIRDAIGKRPVSDDDIDQLVTSIDDFLQRSDLEEISSKAIGDLVLKGLVDLDSVAYIRYAIVYLELDSLEAIRDEIELLQLPPPTPRW